MTSFWNFKTRKQLRVQAAQDAKAAATRTATLRGDYGIDGIAIAKFNEAKEYSDRLNGFVRDVENWLGAYSHFMSHEYKGMPTTENIDLADKKKVRRLGLRWHSNKDGVLVNIGYLITQHPNDGVRAEFIMKSKSTGTDGEYTVINDAFYDETDNPHKKIIRAHDSFSSSYNYPSYEAWVADAGKRVPQWFVDELSDIV
jgi:hypothetical protein